MLGSLASYAPCGPTLAGIDGLAPEHLVRPGSGHLAPGKPRLPLASARGRPEAPWCRCPTFPPRGCFSVVYDFTGKHSLPYNAQALSLCGRPPPFQISWFLEDER